MKLLSLCLIYALFLPYNSNAQHISAKPGAKKPATNIKINSPNDSLQYILGAFLGQWITNNGFTITNQEMFKQGLDDVLLKKTLQVNPDGVVGRLDAYQKQIITKRSSQQEALLFANIRGKSGVGILPSGVGYFIMKNGTGIRPQPTDSVLLHVKGFLPDGKAFEDTYMENAPLKGTPATFIPGLSEALQIMPVGSIWRVFVPSVLAYGANGVAGLIPGHSALIFEVELINAIRNQ